MIPLRGVCLNREINVRQTAIQVSRKQRSLFCRAQLTKQNQTDIKMQCQSCSSGHHICPRISCSGTIQIVLYKLSARMITTPEMFEAYLESIIHESENVNQYLNKYEKKHGTEFRLACNFFYEKGRTYNRRQPSLIILFSC
jgi:hypothetical protein